MWGRIHFPPKPQWSHCGNLKSRNVKNVFCRTRTESWHFTFLLKEIFSTHNHLVVSVFSHRGHVWELSEWLLKMMNSYQNDERPHCCCSHRLWATAINNFQLFSFLQNFVCLFLCSRWQGCKNRWFCKIKISQPLDVAYQVQQRICRWNQDLLSLSLILKWKN